MRNKVAACILTVLFAAVHVVTGSDWLQWRGPGVAAFEPRVVRVVGGKAATSVTFDKPGRYVLRAYAEDASIHTAQDVQVTVVAAGTSQQ